MAYAIIRHTKSTSSPRSLHDHLYSPRACATFVLHDVLSSLRLKPFSSSPIVFTPMDPDNAADSPHDCTGHGPVLAPGSPAARKRKPRRTRQEGAVRVAIMISDTRGLWHADMIRSAAERPRGANSATGVFGVVLTRWRLASTDAGRNEALGFSRVGVSSNAGRYSLWRGIPLLGHGSEGRHLCMWASWTHIALLKMLEPCEVEPLPVEDGAPERLSVRTLVARGRHQCEVDIPPVDCLMVAPLSSSVRFCQAKH